MQSACELIEPRTAAEAAASLREATELGRRVSLSGRGGDLAVSTARLDRIVEHEATDLTCIVEPGVRLSELEHALAPHGQRLALDPPGDPTIGECIAEGLSGPLRHRYGAVRDLILGVTVVLADGTIASSGGKVVKNVAGYDLAKLFCGSRGTLGLVVRAAFRLHPRPETTSTFSMPAARPADVRPLLAELARSKLVPGALDLIWPGALLGLLEGSRRVVEAQAEEALRFAGAAICESDVWDTSHERQRQAAGVMGFAPSELADVLRSDAPTLVRPSLGIAYLDRPYEHSTSSALRDLHQRLRRQFDPEDVLVG